MLGSDELKLALFRCEAPAGRAPALPPRLSVFSYRRCRVRRASERRHVRDRGPQGRSSLKSQFRQRMLEKHSCLHMRANKLGFGHQQLRRMRQRWQALPLHCGLQL